uniref:DNA-processing protein DprA n=1 Tax=Kribbia dieselivorans TaxID=331526 RepID=UPI000837F449
LLTPADEQWPAGLHDLDRIAGPAHGAPHCLWVRGPLDLGEASRRAVAMVGSRAATSYGEQQARELAAGVADRGWTVFSGAAFGIDAAAHQGALAVDGATVAVLACGVDQAYPRSHHALIDAIAATGAVVSELPPGFAPLRHRFLARNRLIAAMTSGTCVVEAGYRSGALNTARTAEALSRQLCAVPGPVTHMSSAGTHDLIRKGATLITDAGELIDAVAPTGQGILEEVVVADRPLDGLSPEERRVHDRLRIRREVTVDELSRLTSFATATVLSVLGRLEVLGWATRGPAGGWRKARRADEAVTSAVSG